MSHDPEMTSISEEMGERAGEGGGGGREGGESLEEEDAITKELGTLAIAPTDSRRGSLEEDRSI